MNTMPDAGPINMKKALWKVGRYKRGQLELYKVLRILIILNHKEYLLCALWFGEDEYKIQKELGWVERNSLKGLVSANIRWENTNQRHTCC